MLTPAQRTWVVDRSNAKGQMSRPGANGFMKASWMKAMENLRAIGLARPNAHGEYELTSKGEAYKEGALAAEMVWPVYIKQPPTRLGTAWGLDVAKCVSDIIGPNVHHLDETLAGASERWADLRANRAVARCRVLPRHSMTCSK